MTLRLVLPALLAAILLSALASPPAAAVEPYKKRFGDWTVFCRHDSGSRVCSLYTNGVTGAGRARAPIPVGLSVEAPIGGTPVVALALAGRRFAARQIVLIVDDGQPTPARHGAAVALVDGAPGERLIRQFKAGRRVLIHFTVAETGQQQALFLSLAGFTRAFDSYKAQLFLDYDGPERFG